MGRKVPGGAVWTVFGAAFACLLACPAAFAYTSQEKMSRGIDLYEAGKDSEAMDVFMDVLISGDASEKSLANDYLNRITRRMGGEQQRVAAPAAAAPPPVPLREPPKPPAASKAREEPRRSSPKAAAAEPAAPPGPSPEKMREAIEDRIAAAKAGALAALRSQKTVRLAESDAGIEGVGLPSALLFESEVGFRFPSAQAPLDALTTLLYSLGDAKATVLPEGYRRNESKVPDMRRAMALRTYLTQRGLSPARVKVALLSSDVQVPAALRDFGGLIVVVEKTPLRLSADPQVGGDGSAPVSLGVWPDHFKVSEGEGVFIEFSVLEPKEGVASWKFQMFSPPATAGAAPELLQEVPGDSPVMHQIYWNGRKAFLGEALPFGRYEVVVTAKTLKGKESSARREIVVEKDVAPPSAPPKVEAVELPPVAAEGVELSPEGSGARKQVRKLRAKKEIWPVKKPKAALRAPALPKAAKAEGASAAAVPGGAAGVGGVSNFTVYFEENTPNVMNDKALQQVPAIIAHYPLANVNLMGYASRGERDPAALAEKRVKVVAELLVQKYQIDKSKIISRSQMVEDENAVVEIFVSQSSQDR